MSRATTDFAWPAPTGTPPEPLTEPTRDELRLETVLGALSDPLRLTIVRTLLSESEQFDHTCGWFGFDRPKSSLTHHFRALRDAGVLRQRQYGLERRSQVRIDDLEARFPGLLRLIAAWRPPQPASAPELAADGALGEDGPMPHITVEYSAALGDGFDRRGFALALHAMAAPLIDSPLETFKTRFYPVEEVIGDGVTPQTMVHVDVALIAGRRPDVKQSLGQATVDLLAAHLRPSVDSSLQATVDVRDFDSYHKRVLG